MFGEFQSPAADIVLHPVDAAARGLSTGDPVRVSSELGSIEVRVDVRETGPHTAPELDVEVRDTGVGFDTAALDRLFQRFTQADGAITRRFGGTGLGLAISRRLAELHHHLGGVGLVSSLDVLTTEDHERRQHEQKRRGAHRTCHRASGAKCD
mgnify:CR=1 FL=1